jgi:peptidyl-prolyl cis-trans isomerase B (cyclophilin B)
MRIASTVIALVVLLTGSLAGAAPKGKAKKNPMVEISTSMGNITVELYPDKAPKSVENFLGYVKSGFYNGTIFHRVIADFMIQGGGFDEKYGKKETKAAITNEAGNGLKNDRGTLAMARTPDPHSATAQFFINVKSNDALNHTGKDPAGWGYCVFGKVTKGMDVVDKIRNVPTGAGGPFAKDAPQKLVVIKKARVL